MAKNNNSSYDSSEYDSSNIFTQIISGAQDAEKIYEDEFSIAIFDKFPVAPVHILVIPKGRYINYSHFISNAPDKEIISYFKAIEKVISIKKLEDFGYRLITNCKANAGQSIFHFHTHIISGKELTKLI